MKKQLLIIGIITLLVSVVLSGCNSTKQTTGLTPEDKILGNWIGKEYYDGTYENGTDRHYTFYGNGTCSFSIESSYYAGRIFWESYVFKGEQLIFTRSDGNESAMEYSFSSDSKQLTLTNDKIPGYIYILDRQ